MAGPLAITGQECQEVSIRLFSKTEVLEKIQQEMFFLSGSMSQPGTEDAIKRVIERITHRNVFVDAMRKERRENVCYGHTEQPFVVLERGSAAVANANRN